MDETGHASDKTERALEFFRVLADADRIRIVAALVDRPLSGEQLAREVILPISVVVRHLQRLESFGLVRSDQADNGRVYHFDADALQALKRSVLGGERPSAVTDGGDEWERKVLRDFLDGDRLKSIPAQTKKRAVILRWLAERFAAGERYPEREVNAMLSQAHPDFATLRRELIDSGLMRREGGVYWRVRGDS